jgi:hypothetical protein
MNFLVSYILSHPSLTMCNFAHLSHIVGGYILPAGMRVWVVCTRTRTRVPDGYMMLPICVLVGKNMIPYPPLYRVNPSGTRVSGTHCHLYPHLTPLAIGSLERCLLVFSTPGVLTGNDLSHLFFTCTNTSQAATCTYNT